MLKFIKGLSVFLALIQTLAIAQQAPIKAGEYVAEGGSGYGEYKSDFPEIDGKEYER